MGKETDRELLELAAKAYGIEGKWFAPMRGILLNGGEAFNGGLWNPLEDDGDALRLAVKLKMNVDLTGASSDIIGARDNGLSEEMTWLHLSESLYQVDAAESCRRAIVRAAAEIGKGMK